MAGSGSKLRCLLWLHMCQKPDESRAQGGTGIPLGLQLARAMVKQRHEPHEHRVPQVLF